MRSEKFEINEKWLLDRGAAEDIDVAAGSRDDTKLVIETEKQKQRRQNRKRAAAKATPAPPVTTYQSA